MKSRHHNINSYVKSAWYGKKGITLGNKRLQAVIHKVNEKCQDILTVKYFNHFSYS